MLVLFRGDTHVFLTYVHFSGLWRVDYNCNHFGGVVCCLSGAFDSTEYYDWLSINPISEMTEIGD
jgi:hypothetical protein